MNKIDTTTWKNFVLGELFNLINSKAYHTKDVLESNDGINYVTRSKFNNGIKFKVEKTDDLIINPANTISFGAENADFFVQTEEYITGNKMYYIDTQRVPFYALLFIKTILEKTFTSNYSFSDGMIPERIRDKTIRLPATVSGEPDFSYMEQYMKNLETTVCSTLTELQSAPKLKEKSINTIDWYEFTVEQISDSVNIAKSYDFGKLREGKTPFINRSGNNNGIQGFVNVEPTEKKNCITVGMVGNSKSAFWQTVDFATSQNILIIRNNKLNEFSGRFLCSVLNSLLKEMRDYTTIIKKDEFKKQKIKLPAISPLEPDWEYMEHYMKNIEKQVNQSIETLTCVIK